jgi:hypothetical protein
MIVKGTLKVVGLNDCWAAELRKLFNRQFRYILIFILFDDDADNFHQRRERATKTRTLDRITIGWTVRGGSPTVREDVSTFVMQDGED